MASPAEPDPIFAVIEAHKAAMAEYTRLVHIKSVTPFAEKAFADAEEDSDQAYDLVDDAQTALLTTKPTTLAGAAAVLTYVSSFWIEGDESSEKGLPIYETLAHDDELRAGANFLPMLASAIEQITAQG